MSATLEKMENCEALLTLVIAAEKFEEGMQQSYLKNRGQVNMPGFRKGKVPRALLEKQYGKAFLYDDAIEYVFPEAYEAAMKDSDETIISRPQLRNFKVEENGDAVMELVLTTKPVPTVNNYKGFTFTKQVAEVTEEEVVAEIKKAAEKNARVSTVERAVEDGDIVSLNFVGYVDGEAFEGGEGKNFDLTIGSGQFIDTFETQLIGKNVGDDVEVFVTFPEEYHAENLQGKPAKFDVEILEVKHRELPEINDEFAQDVSEFDTLDEYKADVLAKLKEQKENDCKRKKEDEVLAQLIDEVTCFVPDAMVENQAEKQVDDMRRNIEQRGMSFDMYMQFMGQTVDSMMESMMENARKNVKLRLGLEAVVRDENIVLTDAEIDEQVQSMATSMGFEYDKLKVMLGEQGLERVTEDLKIERAVELVQSYAVETEPVETAE